MKNILLASAMVAVMASPAAFAQSVTSETSVSRSVTPTGDDAVSVKRSEKSVDIDGTQVERSKSVKADADGGVHVKRTQKVTDADGSQSERSKTYSKTDAGKTVTTQSKTKTPEGAEESTSTVRTTTP